MSPRGAIAAALILGCSSPRAPTPESPAPSVVVPVASVPAPPPPRATEEAPPREPGELREPATVACRIAGVAWSSDNLRLRADGPRFARADRTRATLLVPVVAKPTKAVAVMDDGRVLVRAVLAPEDVHLYAPKPTAFLGIVTPAAKTTLPWASSAPGRVRIGLGTQGVLRAPDPFEVDVACADLVIVSATYNARESITKAKLPKRSVITDGAPLAAAPGAKPVAEVNVGLEVELVETRGAQARILVDRRDLMVSGWVWQKDLGPALLSAGFGYGLGGFGERAYGHNRLYLMHCPSDVSLYVELDAERVKVGVIHKDAGFRIPSETEADKGKFRPIDLPESPWLLMEKDARLLVEAAELDACRQDSPGF